MKNPCKDCLVTAMCTILCAEWFDWVKEIIPNDIYINMDEFNNLTGQCGPFKNYYPLKYNMHQIKFQNEDKSRNRKVCIKLK